MALPLGGLAVGEGKSEREDVCELTAALLPEDRPRYLMGVGTPLDVLEAVHRGVDMFDCIIPTQVAKRGSVFTSRGIVELRRSVYKFSEARLDPECTCPVCAKYSRAYLHHLTKTQEPLGWQLMGQHNIHFYHQLMGEIRQSILEDRFLALYREKREILQAEDIDHPVTTPKSGATKPQQLGEYELDRDLPGIRHTNGQIVPTQTDVAWPEKIRLAQRLRLPAGVEADDAMPLIIWDTDLGAGAPAFSVILAYEEEAQKGPVRPLHIVSFTDDLSPLRLALSHKRHFPYLRHGAADTLVLRSTWESRYCPGLSWTLMHGSSDESRAKAPGPPEITLQDINPGNAAPPNGSTLSEYPGHSPHSPPND